LFSLPQLALVYDPLDPDRTDLDAYARLLEELEVRSVVDVGCGTGTFATMLAVRGLSVTGLDPAEASLQIARGKPGAEAVRWILGDATTPIAPPVDAATMTGNVAQVFISDDEWDKALGNVHDMLRPGGHLVFESRDPTAQAWLGWNREATYREAHIEGVGVVACWEETTAVELPTVAFRTTFEFFRSGSIETSDSTLRFRDRQEISTSLRMAGFDDPQVRDAPDRPGLEVVFIAQRQNS
jgi:SAM-dependent methyltransferase